jgi:two-component system sensor histidine kinase UhpB
VDTSVRAGSFDAATRRRPAHVPAVAAGCGPPRPWRRWVAAWWPAIAALPPLLWHRRSIRGRLLIIVVAIEIVAAVVAGGVTVFKARTSTRVEIEASIRVAELLVTESLRLVRDDVPAARILETLPLQLRFLRHVRLSVRDAADAPVPPPLEPDGADDAPDYQRSPAPAWFYALVAPPIRSEVIPVVAQGQRIGSVVLVSEPADEIAEVWENTVALGLVALAVNGIVLGSLYLLFGRALAPLAGFGRGLIDLERRNYAVRLPAPEAREFAALADGFNALAAALEAARADNVELSRRLISAQDDERRRTALELHDEVGPCLFGLKATAASLANVAGPTAERARDMLGIIEHLQVINRNLLNRLRPMALGHVPLGDLLDRIVRDRAREHPHISFALDAAALAPGYGDAVDLTIYRCMQESLTNAIRHAGAKSVRVTLAEVRDGARARLELAVEDDGRGFCGGTAWGFGLRGMQERVVALGGEFTIANRPGGGTIVRVAIALAAPPDPAAEPAGSTA